MEALNCEACNNTKLWCRACEFGSKRIALQKHGYSVKEVSAIRDYLYDSSYCKSIVPCYLCNRDKSPFWLDFHKQLVKEVTSKQ